MNRPVPARARRRRGPSPLAVLFAFGIALSAGCAQIGGGGGSPVFGGLFGGGIADTRWSFVELLSRPMPGDAAGAESNRLEFERATDGAGGFTASTGCNRMTGRYKVDGQSLRFDITGSTRKACRGEAGMAERRMVAALGATSAWRIEGGKLELLAEGKVMATLARR